MAVLGTTSIVSISQNVHPTLTVDGTTETLCPSQEIFVFIWRPFLFVSYCEVNMSFQLGNSDFWILQVKITLKAPLPETK